MSKAVNNEISNNSRFIDDDAESGSFRLPLPTEILQPKGRKISIDTQIKILRTIDSRVDYQEI